MKEEVFSEKSKPAGAEDDVLFVEGHEIQYLAGKEGLSALPWKQLGVDIVIESTGLFTNAIGEDDMEHTRQTLFASRNLS